METIRNICKTLRSGAVESGLYKWFILGKFQNQYCSGFFIDYETHVYVEEGKNIYGMAITAVSLAEETRQVEMMDFLIGAGVIASSMGASYIHHTIYTEIIREEELKRMNLPEK